MLPKRLMEYDYARQDEKNLFIELRNHLDLIPKAKDILKHKEECYKSLIRSQLKSIAKLKDQLEDEIILADIKVRYADRWENSRQEQTQLKIDREEKAYLDTIREYTDKINYENRVHSEMIRYIEISIFVSLFNTIYSLCFPYLKNII